MIILTLLENSYSPPHKIKYDIKLYLLIMVSWILGVCARKRSACIAGWMSGWLVMLGMVMTGQVSGGPQRLLLQEDFNGPPAVLTGRQANSGQVWRSQTARWSTGGLQTGLAFGQRHTAGGGWRHPPGMWK